VIATIVTLVLHSIPADFASLVYSTGIKYGSWREWDKVWKRAQTTHVVSEAEIMMRSLGHTRHPWLMWRHVYITVRIWMSNSYKKRNRPAFRVYGLVYLWQLLEYVEIFVVAKSQNFYEHICVTFFGFKSPHSGWPKKVSHYQESSLNFIENRQ